MTGTEMNGLVDKLADKLDVAVDKVLPVAQEALDQFVARETMFGIGCFFAALLCVVGFYVGWRVYSRKEESRWGDDNKMFGGMTMMVSGLVAGLFCGLGLGHIGNALAPLAALVGI